MKRKLYILAAFCLSGCFWPEVLPDEVMTQEVEVANESSQAIRVSSYYTSDYSSSACTNVDAFDDVIGPGETLAKTLKIDCTDTWTVDFLLSFEDTSGVSFSDSLEVFASSGAGCDSFSISNLRSDVAYFLCDDNGCESVCRSESF